MSTQIHEHRLTPSPKNTYFITGLILQKRKSKVIEWKQSMFRQSFRLSGSMKTKTTGTKLTEIWLQAEFILCWIMPNTLFSYGTVNKEKLLNVTTKLVLFLLLMYIRTAHTILYLLYTRNCSLFQRWFSVKNHRYIIMWLFIYLHTSGKGSK